MLCMNATHPQANPEFSQNLTVMHVLAELLERLDRSSKPVGAQQYRAVAAKLAGQFAQTPPSAAMHALLETHPSAAELYENLNYAHAGLCRSALDASVRSEADARALIERARHLGASRPANSFTDKEDNQHGKS
jgi:hypothetical protein